MRCSIAALSLLTLRVIAAPTQERRVTPPSVSIQNGTVIGSTLAGIDTFNGIPFALPPTSSRRLKPPQTLTAGFPSGTFTATGVPTACPQFYVQVDTDDVPTDVVGELLDSPIFQAATNTGEDCLSLNVQRPSTATSSSKLPVVVWIFGGGFEFGSTQTYSGDNIIAKSVALGEPVIFVAVSYRVSGFGFLAGAELQAEGSTNLGLRDQRLALEWVQDNIAAFGGDPTKVTLWGESAGAISVFDHTVINGGDNTYKGNALFRAAIMDSGSVVPSEAVNSGKAQTVFDSVVSHAGCSSSSDKLACLRALDYTTFLNAVNSQPAIFSYSALNLAYLPRPDPANNFFSQSPELSIEAGEYTKVPIIIGDQEDEGTLFSLVLYNVTTDAELKTYVGNDFPNTTQSIVDGFVDTYPEDISAGSPFRTGLLNEIYPGYKRLAALQGDVVFSLRRRQYLNSVASTVKAWSYLDSHLYGTAVLGTFHASDLLQIYFDLTSPVTMATYLTYYVAFINNLDPNSLGTSSPLIDWPQYDTSDPQLVQFNAANNVLLADTFRSDSYDYLQQYPSLFRV